MAMTDRGNHTRVGVVTRPQLPPEHLPAAVREIEDAGIDDAWLWEDSFWNGGLVAAAAALSATSTMHVGLGVMPTPLRNPALAAMEIATLNRLHPGRFTPALGHGVRAWMQQAGAAVESPLTLMREYATAVRALLHGREVTVTGRYVQLDRVRLSHPPPPDAIPPLLIGANGPKALRLAAEIADGVVLGDIPTVDAVVTAVAALNDARSSSDLEHEFFDVVGYVHPTEDPGTQVLDLASAGLTTIVFTCWEGDPHPRRLFESAEEARSALSHKEGSS